MGPVVTVTVLFFSVVPTGHDPVLSGGVRLENVF
jgi:hypothetical protein